MKRGRSPDAPGKATRKKSTPAIKNGFSPTAFNDIPPYVAYTSPATSTIPSNGKGGQRPATALPLNLVAQIVSYLDDIGDMARVTRTSRLLYYMTLPQLYRRVSLHSYGEMRYVNGRPEGFGSGSPFMLALNGLCTKGHAALVEDFRVWGKWQELGIEDFAKGRVPENSMMLNIILRAATDKMTKLQSFCWELDCKPLKTLYQGLGTHSTLTSFTLRFPSTRVPRPSVLIPPMVNLRVFKALDIDPMCYPDDISLLMLHSKKLEDLRLHFSPRMRAEAESIMNLNAFFGRCHKANYKLKLKHFAMQNWFGPNVLALDQIFDDECKGITFLDTFGGNDPKTIFVDDTWKDLPPSLRTSYECVRVNEISVEHIKIMRNASASMKYLYLVSNSKRQKTGFTPASIGSTDSPLTPNGDGVHTPYDPMRDPEWISLAKEYVQVIGRYHGATLKHLLLSDLWALPPDDVADLVQHCPGLEQLGLALDDAGHESIRLLPPFLPKLKCLRILDSDHLRQNLANSTHEHRMWSMGVILGRQVLPCLEFICLGDYCYKVGQLVDVRRDDGVTEKRREIFLVDKSEAMKFEIWHLDVLDISADPIAPFSK